MTSLNVCSLTSSMPSPALPEVSYRLDDPETVRKITRGIPLEVLEARMRRKNLNDYGMLGPNENLVDVIVSDNQTMHGLGISYASLADAVESKLFSSKGTISFLDNGMVSLLEMTCGDFSCPWSDEKIDGACFVMVFDPKLRQHRNFLNLFKEGGLPRMEKYRACLIGSEPVLVVSGIMPHLIRGHQFFQGKETPYRCDPAQLARTLGVVK